MNLSNSLKNKLLKYILIFLLLFLPLYKVLPSLQTIQIEFTLKRKVLQQFLSKHRLNSSKGVETRIIRLSTILNLEIQFLLRGRIQQSLIDNQEFCKFWRTLDWSGLRFTANLFSHKPQLLHLYEYLTTPKFKWCGKRWNKVYLKYVSLARRVAGHFYIYFNRCFSIYSAENKKGFIFPIPWKRKIWFARESCGLNNFLFPCFGFPILALLSATDQRAVTSHQRWRIFSGSWNWSIIAQKLLHFPGIIIDFK